MGRSAPDGPSAAGPAGQGASALRYPNAEWRLLVRLPGRVLTAALAGQPEDPSNRVRSAVAGLEAIAAGRLFDSDLVRTVASAIYAESGAPARADSADPTHPVRPTDPASPAGPDRGPDRGEPDDVLSWCRAAVRVLDHDTDPADSAAYRQWVQSVAARTAGVTEPAGPATGLVAELGRALNLADGA